MSIEGWRIEVELSELSKLTEKYKNNVDNSNALVGILIWLSR